MNRTGFPKNRADGICTAAWEIIGTAFLNSVPIDVNGIVPKNGTVVPFTEGLLRDITCLTPDQQFELVQDEAWGFVATSFLKSVAIEEDGRVAVNATTVAFTEGLHRSMGSYYRKDKLCNN